MSLLVLLYPSFLRLSCVFRGSSYVVGAPFSSTPLPAGGRGPIPDALLWPGPGHTITGHATQGLAQMAVETHRGPPHRLGKGWAGWSGAGCMGCIRTAAVSVGLSWACALEEAPRLLSGTKETVTELSALAEPAAAAGKPGGQGLGRGCSW